MKKRVLAAITAAVLAISMLAGCGSAASSGTDTAEAPAAEAEAEAEAEAPAADKVYEVGFVSANFGTPFQLSCLI